MPPYRIECLDEAVADVGAIDRSTAMHLFEEFVASPAPAQAISTRCTAT
ncbi:MAG TPA: hypothetical protein VG297_10445 [Bryobacteraceae bacterium]|jgi:hypothetical protein|nr:hypothetical protein [Bryobacteraceae bacterium]